MKKRFLAIPLALLLSLSISCREESSMAELENFKAQLNAREQNIALAKRYIETVNAGDFEALKEVLSPDYAVYNPYGHPEPTSREKLIESYKEAAAAFSEFTWNVEDVFAAGNKVACRIIIRGLYKGGDPGVPAGETEFQFGLITIMRMEDGRVVEEWQEDDQLGFARQLGMELRPREEKK